MLYVEVFPGGPDVTHDLLDIVLIERDLEDSGRVTRYQAFPIYNNDMALDVSGLVDFQQQDHAARAVGKFEAMRLMRVFLETADTSTGFCCFDGSVTKQLLQRFESRCGGVALLSHLPIIDLSSIEQVFRLGKIKHETPNLTGKFTTIRALENSRVAKDYFGILSALGAD